MSARDINRRNRRRETRQSNSAKKPISSALSWTLTAAFITASTTAVALIPAYPVTDVVSSVTKGFGKLQSTVTSDITVMANTHPAAIDGTTDSINAALKIATEQEAQGAQLIAKNATESKKAIAASYQAGQVQANIIKKLMDYGERGQGYNPCLVVAENKVLDTAFKIADESGRSKVEDTDNAPGRLMPSKLMAQNFRQQSHEKFCSEDDVRQGMKCEGGVSNLPGADQNAAILTVSKRPDSLAAEASVAYRQNILGDADIALPQGVGDTAAGQAYLLATNRKSTLNSFPALSLAYVEAMNELNPDLKDKEGNPMSANDALLETVGRYYGGKDAKEWQEKMIQQQPRGILAEMARMEGLSAWMQFNKYKSYQRLLGNAAALNISTVIPLEEDIDTQKSSINSNSVASSIAN